MRPEGIWGLRKRWVRWVILAVAFLSMLAPSAGWAWGKEGHRPTGLIAEQYRRRRPGGRSPNYWAARPLATWRPGRIGIVRNIPKLVNGITSISRGGEATYDRDRNCPIVGTDPQSAGQDCVTDRILFFEQRQRDSSLSREERAIALNSIF